MLSYPYISGLFNFVNDLNHAPITPLLTKAGRVTWMPREEIFRILKTLKPKERQIILPGLRNIANRLGSTGPPRIMQVLSVSSIGRELMVDELEFIERAECISRPQGPDHQWIAALSFGLRHPKLKTLAALLVVASANPPYPWLDSRSFLAAVSEAIGPRSQLPERNTLSPE